VTSLVSFLVTKKTNSLNNVKFKFNTFNELRWEQLLRNSYRGFSTSIKKNDEDLITVLILNFKGVEVSVRRTADWEVNMTQLAKFFKKR